MGRVEGVVGRGVGGVGVGGEEGGARCGGKRGWGREMEQIRMIQTMLQSVYPTCLSTHTGTDMDMGDSTRNQNRIHPSLPVHLSSLNRWLPPPPPLPPTLPLLPSLCPPLPPTRRVGYQYPYPYRRRHHYRCLSIRTRARALGMKL